MIQFSAVTFQKVMQHSDGSLRANLMVTDEDLNPLSYEVKKWSPSSTPNSINLSLGILKGKLPKIVFDTVNLDRENSFAHDQYPTNTIWFITEPIGKKLVVEGLSTLTNAEGLDEAKQAFREWVA